MSDIKFYALIESDPACDYSIACGNDFIEINDVNTMDEAVNTFKRICFDQEYEHYRGFVEEFALDTVKIISVQSEIEMDMPRLYKAQQEINEFEQRKAKEQEERADYERLKKKFG